LYVGAYFRVLGSDSSRFYYILQFDYTGIVADICLKHLTLLSFPFHISKSSKQQRVKTLHESQLYLYNQAALKALRHFAETVILPPPRLVLRDVETLNEYSQRCVRSISIPAWKVNVRDLEQSVFDVVKHRAEQLHQQLQQQQQQQLQLRIKADDETGMTEGTEDDDEEEEDGEDDDNGDDEEDDGEIDETSAKDQPSTGEKKESTSATPSLDQPTPKKANHRKVKRGGKSTVMMKHPPPNKKRNPIASAAGAISGNAKNNGQQSQQPSSSSSQPRPIRGRGGKGGNRGNRGKGGGPTTSTTANNNKAQAKQA